MNKCDFGEKLKGKKYLTFEKQDLFDTRGKNDSENISKKR